MNSLQHLFATGVRFDTEVQYLVAASSGKAADSPGIGRASSYYRNLPLKPRAHEHPSDGAGVTALQCAAVVHQCEPRRIRGSFLPNPCNEAQLQETLQKRFPRLRLEVHVCDAAQNVGAMARQAIEAGWICMVRYESVSFKRWSTVIGVEVAVAVASREVRALLLLDSHASEPWACGHNARIELQGIADQSARATPGFNLRYRHLAGQASQVRLCSLITTRRLA